MKWLKENWKDLLKVVTAVFLVFFVAVFADVFSDSAKTSFWWNFWDVSRWVIGALLLIGWVILWTSKSRD